MRSRLYETENFGENWPGTCRERYEKDFSRENSKGRYAFRNPRIEGKLGRKEEGVIVSSNDAWNQKNGGGFNVKSAQLFYVQQVTISLFYQSSVTETDKANSNFFGIKREKKRGF